MSESSEKSVGSCFSWVESRGKQLHSASARKAVKSTEATALINVLDRLFEHAGFVFVMIFLVLPRKELKQYFCCCCKEKTIDSKSDVLEEFKDTENNFGLEDDY